MNREFSAGGVVFRVVDDFQSGTNRLFLVSKSRPSVDYLGEYWRLPKGWVDDNGLDVPGPKASGKVKATETDLQQTAIREVEEEGGVKAKILKKIKTVKFFYKHKTRGLTFKFVTFFLMEYQSDLKSGFGFETERVEWLTIDKAIEKLSDNREKEILKLANSMIDQK